MSPFGAVAWLLAVMWSRSATSAVRRSEARLRRVLDGRERARIDAQHALGARLRVLECIAAAEDPPSWPFVTADHTPRRDAST